MSETMKASDELLKGLKELGLTELKVKLEEMAADESRHARELNRILRGL